MVPRNTPVEHFPNVEDYYAYLVHDIAKDIYIYIYDESHFTLESLKKVSVSAREARKGGWLYYDKEGRLCWKWRRTAVG